MATQSTTIRCRNDGETPTRFTKRVPSLKKLGWCSFPTSRRSNPRTFPPRSACLYRPGCHCTATHSPARRETRRYTTEDHHLIGGAPLGSKSHDPFHLRDLNTRHLREGYFSSASSVQNFLGFFGPTSLLVVLCSKVLRSFLLN